MKISPILFLVAALGGLGMLVSSLKEHHSPAYEVKNAANQRVNLRGSLIVRTLDSDDDSIINSISSTDSVESVQSNLGFDQQQQ